MFKTRPCGCKGQRSCLVCETEYGAWRLPSSNVTDDDKEGAYVYCPSCEDLAWPGWDSNSCNNIHPHHKGKPYKFKGIKIVFDFISEEEERELVKHIDEVPWSPSQSGRLKQNYGPKCNFKKKKVRVDNFDGYPMFTKFIQDRFKDLSILENFQTVEQCSLEYTPERGASIDPHVDDCWIWGERIPTLSLLSDSTLTMVRFEGSLTKYNLEDSLHYPRMINSNGKLKTEEEISNDFKQIILSGPSHSNNIEEEDCGTAITPRTIRIPMPRRSLLVFYGDPRYNWEHGVIREDITDRRICITYRELTPTYLTCGPHSCIGQQILSAGTHFWDHKEKYTDCS